MFVQRMNPLMTPDGMFDIFSKFGRVMKCEKMLPAHDIWLLQFSRSEVCRPPHSFPQLLLLFMP